MERQCKNCGKVFETEDRRKLHCTLNCAAATSRKRRREAGLCPRCGKETEINSKTGEKYYFCEEHRPRTNEERECKFCGKKFLCRERRQVYCDGACRWKAFNDRRRKAGLCKICGQPAQTNPRSGRHYYYCDVHRTNKQETSLQGYYQDKTRRDERSTELWNRLRDEVVSLYGGKCVCCGDDRRVFLTLDHVRGDGAEDRRRRSRWSIYKDARDQRDAGSYQLLCMNCNFLKKDSDRCPCGTQYGLGRIVGDQTAEG